MAGGQTVSHILFLFPPYLTEQDEQRLRAKAEAVLQQLRNGGEFTALARQYSDGPRQRLVGFRTFRPGELLPGFEETATLKPGEISDVVRTRIGFHIIRLEARQAAGMKPFEEVQEELKTDILRDKPNGNIRSGSNPYGSRPILKFVRGLVLSLLTGILSSTTASDPVMQTAEFYDQPAPCYHLVYPDWEASITNQVAALDSLITEV